MLVRLGWANYDYTDSDRAGPRQDAFWVECSADEGLPLLAERTDDPRVAPETLGWGRSTPYPIDHQRFYFLIARDGSSIVPRSAHYPTSSRWKGGSPFRRVGPFEIGDISELADLPTPKCDSQQSGRTPHVREAINIVALALSRLAHRRPGDGSGG
ncbi:MAG TPA: hypothetical protein VNZ01_02050 [Solirubrobacteraceae bacterium]|jgi:hypothetical protein|nr:hypothetical protein [Solirubrobacteraceae bacterium]